MTSGPSAGKASAWVKAGIGFTATLALVAAALLVHGSTLGSLPDGSRIGTALRTCQGQRERERRLQPHERLHAGMTQDEVRSVLGEPDVDLGPNRRGETRWSYTLGSRLGPQVEDETLRAPIPRYATAYWHPRFLLLRFRDGKLSDQELKRP